MISTSADFRSVRGIQEGKKEGPEVQGLEVGVNEDVNEDAKHKMLTIPHYPTL